MKTTIFAILILLLGFTSCTKLEKTNPFDPNCPKELWTPTNFIATLEGTTVKLTWRQPVTLISGFKITKKVGQAAESALANQANDASQLSDNALTGGQVHIYTLYAYAENNQSNSVTAQVTPVLPATLTTSNPTSVLSNSLIVGGAISTDGGSPITERGICWGTTTNPTTATNKLAIGTGTGTFSNTITGLLPGTLYYFRAYAINTQGTAYGNEVTATTTAILPVITTIAPSTITSTTATSGGNITSDGGATVTARGVCWSTTQTPTITNYKTTDGTGTGSFISSIAGLTAGTTYYVRAYSTNSAGTGYGTQVSFTTTVQVQLPILTTTSATAITNTTATSGGSITFDGGATVTARGVCWSTSQNPTIANSKTVDGTGTGSFISSITGLTAGTTYYVRAYSTNSVGTGYGTQVSFTTSSTSGSTVTDIDGNVYNTVTIGSQVWMVENLKTTKYRSGDLIANVTDNAAWAALATGAYCWYNNNAATYKATYGALYNWYAVADSRNIAPTGWHVPTDAEWTILKDYLGGTRVADGKLKEAGTAHWLTPNTDATNSTGFTALPGGYRLYLGGAFYDVGEVGYWWSSTAYDAYNAWYRDLYYYYNANAYRVNNNKQEGFSVRCVRD